jgi:hypothetical protein
MCKRKMHWIVLSTLFAAEVWVGGITPPVYAQDSRLTLSTPRRDYLLGEPVVLELALRNTSKEAIKLVEIFVEPLYYEATLWIARNDRTFEQFHSNAVIPKTKRRTLVLGPGDALKYHYRVVGTPWPKFRFAFPAPGDYRVYVVYPLWVVGVQETTNIKSNIVAVRIKQPEGEDAKVWEELKNPSLLTLLQTESVPEGWENEVRQLGKLLHTQPKSGYAPALRHLLVKLAPRMHGSLSFDEATRWGEMLGIKGFAWVEEDPADNRLDAIRKDSFMKETSVGDVLKSLSKASGAMLEAPPETKAKTIRIADSQASVRECMRTLRHFGAWERRGDGYFLAPIQPSADKPKNAKTNQDN